MENPRILLAKFIDDRISAGSGSWAAAGAGPDRREHGELTEFLERLDKALGYGGDFHRLRAYAWQVRAGNKPISRKSFDGWVKALRLSKGTPDYERFEDLVDQGRLWGKENGRKAWLKIEARAQGLKDQVLALTRDLQAEREASAAKDAKLAEAEQLIASLTVRLEALES